MTATPAPTDTATALDTALDEAVDALETLIDRKIEEAAAEHWENREAAHDRTVTARADLGVALVALAAALAKAGL